MTIHIKNMHPDPHVLMRPTTISCDTSAPNAAAAARAAITAVAAEAEDVRAWKENTVGLLLVAPAPAAVACGGDATGDAKHLSLDDLEMTCV